MRKRDVRSKERERGREIQHERIRKRGREREAK